MNKLRYLFLILVIFCYSFSSSELNIALFIDDYISIKYDIQLKTYLFVSIKRQEIFLISDGQTLKSYPISSAKNGVGEVANSEQTPLGLHAVKQKIGDNLPKAAILKERSYTGEIATIITDSIDIDKDDVTSRILWLTGMEKGINKGGAVDSYNRYIYIHGTAEEGLIGQPASHGCIRMNNDDIIELYNLIAEDTPVLILNY